MGNEQNDSRLRESDGSYSETYSPEDILDALTDHEQPMTTREVGEALDCDKDTARRKLTVLETDGAVSKQEIGQTYVWSLTGEIE